MTKAYTLASLIKEVSSVKYNANTDQLVELLSPRAGRAGLKIFAINNFLNGKFGLVVDGNITTITGASARTRLLRALRYRKTYGTF